MSTNDARIVHWIPPLYVDLAFLKLAPDTVGTLLTITKRCEVCGGNVIPVDDQSPFGYCEVCGIVYALKDRLQGRRTYETPKVVKLKSDEESREPESQARAASADTEESNKRSGSNWRCPDCGVDLYADSDSDLEFVKREHIREYHPNRSS